MKRAYSRPDDYFHHIDAPTFDVRSPADGAVFYSDDYQSAQSNNRVRAENYARQRSADGHATTTLEQTPGGRWLDDEKLFEPGSPIDDPDANVLWSRCSKKYAQQASGDARCFVTGSSPRSVFRKVELPALLANPNITSLNGVPREKLATIYDKDPEAAFKAVEAADTALRAASAPELALASSPPSMASGGGGPLQVINAVNSIICTGCPTPLPLRVTMNQTVNCSSQLCATIADCMPIVNITPFGPCLFTPAPPSPSGGPCIPKPVGTWRPGSVMTSHQKIPALRQTDTLQCASGGMIMVANPGQAQAFVT